MHTCIHSCSIHIGYIYIHTATYVYIHIQLYSCTHAHTCICMFNYYPINQVSNALNCYMQPATIVIATPNIILYFAQPQQASNIFVYVCMHASCLNNKAFVNTVTPCSVDLASLQVTYGIYCGRNFKNSSPCIKAMHSKQPCTQPYTKNLRRYQFTYYVYTVKVSPAGSYSQLTMQQLYDFIDASSYMGATQLVIYMADNQVP